MKHRSVLVTGGTGSFGKAFIRRLLDDGVERVVCFSRDELKQSEMRAAFNDPRIRFMIGDVIDRDRLTRAMQGVDLVVHAAAMKQIDTCELHPDECVKTNVLGTRAVIDAVLFAHVPRAIFLGTDKAAAPATHYGACKLVAERMWTQANVYAAGTPTRFSATRYGNVIRSRGSVLGVWKEQAKAGDSITITHRHITRFFMRIEDAVDLVLLAAEKMRGGEVFVPRIGSALITTLAEAAHPDKRTVETGIRRGEKLHETLIGEDEARNAYDHGDYYTIEPDRTWEDVSAPIDATPVDPGWSYRSDTGPHMDVATLRGLIGW